MQFMLILTDFILRTYLINNFNALKQFWCRVYFEAVLFALKLFNFILLYLQLKNLPLQCTVLFQHLMPLEAKPVEIH